MAQRERTGVGRPTRQWVGAGIALWLGVAGCGRVPAAMSGPVRFVEPAALPQMNLAPTWQRSLPGAATLSVAQDGSGVAGTGAGGPWAYQATGRRVSLPTGEGSAVWALSGAHFVLGPGLADPPGTVQLLNRHGVALWSMPAIGPVEAVGNRNGSRVLVLDAGSGSAVESVVRGPGAPGAVPLGTGLSGEVDSAGAALVVSARHATLYSPSGARRWTISLTAHTPPRSFVVDRGGSGVTVATVGADHALYQFSVAGRSPGVEWERALPPGGSDGLVAGPGGRVAVWGLGGPATLAVFREASGQREWQDTFLPEGAAGPSLWISSVAFWDGGGLAVAINRCLPAATSPAVPGGSPRGCVLLLDAHGGVQGMAGLPGGAATALAADGSALVAEWASAGTGAPFRLAWYSLAAIGNAAG